jgi:hypothetical protein
MQTERILTEPDCVFGEVVRCGVDGVHNVCCMFGTLHVQVSKVMKSLSCLFSGHLCFGSYSSSSYTFQLCGLLIHFPILLRSAVPKSMVLLCLLQTTGVDLNHS